MAVTAAAAAAAATAERIVLDKIRQCKAAATVTERIVLENILPWEVVFGANID
jgi:hypothetical protein